MNNSNFNQIKSRFDSYHSSAIKSLAKNHKNALVLAKNNALALVGSALLLSTSGLGHAQDLKTKNQNHAMVVKAEEQSQRLLNDFELMNNTLLQNVEILSSDQELQVENALTSYFGSTFKVTVDNNRLNKVWGYFGQEQHLYRWPGDTLDQHIDELDHGIAPGRGAFGYFDNAEQEKYYIAAPIHLLPNWNTNWSTLKPWYRFRKVLVYNPINQKGIIAVIGDAGPAAWTGKEFGGSPELMAYLDMYDGRAKSKAVVLFVEDQNLPLGPISSKYQITNLAQTN